MNLSNLGALFIFSVLLARYLGKESLGLYALFTATLMPFVFLVDFGQSTSLVRTLGQEPDKTNQVLRQAMLAKVLLSAAAVLLLVLVTPWLFPVAPERDLFWLFSVILLPRAIYLTLEAGLRAHSRMKALAAVAASLSALLVAGSILLIVSGFSLQRLIVFLIVIETLKAAALWVVCRSLLQFRFVAGPARQMAGLGKMLSAALPFFVTGVVGILYYRVDVIMLAWMRDNAAVGEFSAAANFVKMMRMIPSVIVAAFFPTITSLRAGAAIRSLTARTLWLQAGTSVALASVVFLLAPDLITWTYDIAESVSVLRIFVWSLVPLALYSTLLYVLFNAQRPHWCVKIVASAFCANIMLNFVLIPRFGAKALAISSVLSESFCLVLSAAAIALLWKQERITRAKNPLAELAEVFSAVTR